MTVLDLSSETTLERQVMYDSLVCGEFLGKAAQAWCLGRVLDTGKNGLVTATTTKVFASLRASAGGRARDLCFTRAPLYQLSYRGGERLTGLGPATSGLGSRRSAN